MKSHTELESSWGMTLGAGVPIWKTLNRSTSLHLSVAGGAKEARIRYAPTEAKDYDDGGYGYRTPDSHDGYGYETRDHLYPVLRTEFRMDFGTSHIFVAAGGELFVVPGGAVSSDNPWTDFLTSRVGFAAAL